MGPTNVSPRTCFTIAICSNAASCKGAQGGSGGCNNTPWGRDCILTCARQDKHGLALPEASNRWLQHHSALQQDDAVIIGAATVKQLEMNLIYGYVSEIKQAEDIDLCQLPFQRRRPPARGRG